MNAKNILVTGVPGCGKSTLIVRIIERLKIPATGFVTREIREGGRRLGFAIDTLDGKHGILAHVGHAGSWRVGKYGVSLETIESIAVPSLRPPSSEVLVVIDEIGKMECLARPFRDAVSTALDAPNRVLGSIALHGDSFIERIKSRPDVALITVTPANREALVSTLADALHAASPRWSAKRP